ANLEIKGGVTALERRTPQRLIAHVALNAAAPFGFSGDGDALEHTVDYSRLRVFLCRELPRLPPASLLEAVAERILAFCFNDPRVVKARVRLEKVDLYPETEGVGVELARERQIRQGVALVTGGAQRLGRGIALHLAQAGWDIALHYNASRKEAEETATSIRAMGQKAHLVQADLEDATAVARILPSLGDTLGPITALVNNASLFEPDENDPNNARHRAINLEAPRRLGEDFYRQLPPESDGAIVNILDGTATAPGFAAYAASKTALEELTLKMATAFAPRLRVNAIAPGPVLIHPRQSEKHFADLCAVTRLRKATPPSAVAETAQFLITNPAITGEIIRLS
ncbi:MAG: SDR family NAD(P)-dependent oxidoreductase, partial [Alphaproteobacteria bacterium]|nr:SDR family NAD(P)-dependent oxidoreductase [Alphaproteobacteria bacterium]